MDNTILLFLAFYNVIMIKLLAKPFLLVLILFSTLCVSAQFTRFGIRAGVNSAEWTGDNFKSENIQYNQKFGGFIGFYSTLDNRKNWNFEYGLNVSLKGFNLSGQLIVPGVNLGSNINNHSIYIDIPIAMRYYLGKRAPAGFFLKAGSLFEGFGT